MKHLRVFLILIALLLWVSGAALCPTNAGGTAGRGALTPRVYLPLVARSAPTVTPSSTLTATSTTTATPTATPTPTETPMATPTATLAPGTWITLLEEGFEAASGPLWRFSDDNDALGGAYQWGPRDCQPAAGFYSAWAVGGGADGEPLTCGSPYPDNVATTMIYGPFSLADTKMAQMRFKLRYDQMLSGDDFCWYASDGTVAGGLCLNAQPSGWTTLGLDLGALDTGTQVVSMLGKPQVWVAFRFTSNAAGHTSPGPFVDDVVIRKCLDTLCSPFRPRPRPAPDQMRAIRMLPTGQ